MISHLVMDKKGGINSMPVFISDMLYVRRGKNLWMRMQLLLREQLMGLQLF